jgi:HK97 gp10 family phage protein
MAKVVVNPTWVKELESSREARDFMDDAGNKVAERARVLAPKSEAPHPYKRPNYPRPPGFGASTITHVVSRDPYAGLHVDISWGPEAFYLKWHELGSGHQSARPFLRPALASLRLTV